MNLKRSISKRLNKLLGTEALNNIDKPILNLYKTDYKKTVLISYICAPFRTPNHFTHQNYITSHLVAENFSELGYNVDVVNYTDNISKIDYGKYAAFFGFGYCMEQAFYFADRKIPRITFVTGAHDDLHNEMSLKSIKDFYQLSGLWLAGEASVHSVCSYFSLFNADAVIIFAKGHTFEYFQKRYENKLYSLNNNIIGSFSQFKIKTAETRNKNFLFLCGARLVTKGLHFFLEVAKLRKDLNFYVVVPHIHPEFENYYYKELHNTPNIFFNKNLRMDSTEMKDIIENCSYSVAPSYIDGLPGGTIEPMSAGLIPIVSKFCGFAHEKFIFEMEDLSVQGLNAAIDRVLALSDTAYAACSAQAKDYVVTGFSVANVKADLMKILKLELPG